MPKRGKRRFQRSSFSLIFLNSFILVAILFFTLLTLTFFTSVLDYQKVRLLIPFLGLSGKEGLQIQGNVIDQKAGGSDLVQQSLTSSVAEEPLTLTPRRLGTHNVPESSGVVASRQYPSVYWMHGDSVQAASIIAVNASGATIKAFNVLGSNNIDWEDIALDENNNIWIADIGNNPNPDPTGPIPRGTLVLYKVPEPDPYGAGTQTQNAVAYRFQYPDERHDAEGMFIWQNVPYVVEKRTNLTNRARIYKFPEPLNSSSIVTLQLFAEFTNNGNRITGADISRDGERLALINDGADYHWIIKRNSSSTTIADFFNAPSRQWRIQFNNNQGEAIGFVNGKYDFVVASETGDFWGIDRSQYDPLLEFIFAAGGDHGSNSNTNASLDVLNRSGASFYLALGDMSYGVVGQESIWCDLVKSHLNATYPFELVSGNHEEDGGPNGRIMSFAGCLPDRLSASGIYGAEYFFDYLNLTRIIMISPGLTVGGVSYTYFSGNSHYTWLSNVIDTARAQGIPWVIVGMHKNCITSATKSCEIGADLLNLLLNKKVDLILQGHDHVYERSKQLTCATSGSYLPSCVADDGSDGIYTQGAGSVLVITGVFGQSLYAINTGDSEAGYFAKWMGSNINPTYGFTRFFVNQSEISVDFLRSIGGTFTDSFRIVNASLVTSPLRLQAFHRNGQTFLTWNEAGNYFPENLNFSQYDNIRNANPGIGYRIYRYIAPINSSNLNQATRIAEVGVGTGYNFYLYGKESSDSWGSRAGQDIPRFVIQEGIGGWGSGELPLNTGLYVHTTAESSGNFYYAITLVNNSLENRTDFSSLQSPVSEVYDQNWKPILQNRSFVNETWYTGLPSVRAYYYAGDQHFFTRWEIPQLTDLASRPNNYRVVIPYNVAPPYKVDMNLHCWGSSLVSCNKLVFYSDGIYLTSTDYPPQSWWTGWNENLSFTSSQNQWTGINRYYTMHRMISFIDWMKTQWSIDNNRIMCSGWSMGGSGGKMFCLRYGNYFNYINSWAGVGVAKSSPLFNESFIGLFGSISRGILDENGFNSWDDLNMSWWLRTYPLQETPFISFSNAKNDGGIGWEQAVEFYQALRDTKRPFTFRWSQEGHENHALDMSLIELSDYAGANRIDFQKNRAIPAFTRFSLDNNPGNGDPANGDSVGYINAYQRWDPNTIVDQLNHFEIELWMNSSINLTGTMDITLRSLQFFSVSPGEFFSWTLYQGVTLVQQGTSVADSLGLVSVLGIVLVNNTKRKLVVTTGGGSSTPTINSVSGMVSHGQNIVIGGSGFGTKTTAAPVVWDDASGASPQQTWDFILPTTNELQYRPAYRTPAQVTNASGAIIGVPLPHNHISRYFSGAHYINLGSGGYYSSSNVVAGMNNRQGQTNSYISYYVRISPDWFFTDMGGIGGNDHNFKEYQYDAGNGYFGGSQKNSYFGYFNPDQLQATWGVNYIEGMNVSIFSVNTTLDTWYPQYNTVFSTAPIPNIRDDWRKVEFLLIHNSASGYHKIYHDNVLNMEVYLDDDGLDSSIPPERSETVIGGFARESGNSTKSQSLSNNWRYYADVYYDSSFSRVMLANDVNYDLATIIEPQVPSAWSDGSVTVKVNLGRLPDTGTAYLFIFNSSNGRNVNGYAVTVSGSVPDTTPPTIPTGLTATPFSSSQINLAWNPSSDSESGVLRYNVWRDNVLVRQPSTTSVADSSLFPSTTYSYEVSAVNGAGLESARTSSVSATTPAAPDATPPTVSITTPFNGAVVNGTLTVNATASDIVGVAGVRFLVDGNQVGTEDTTAPYSRTWNTSTASNGLHVVTVIARDAAGNTASANVTVSVSNSVPADTTPPTVPTNFAVTANTSYQVNLSWNPSLDSDSGVANYRVYRNNVLIGQPLGTSFSDATVGPGAIYLYTVAAVNLVGLFSENSSTLSVATPTLPPPALAITSPVQGSIVTARDVVVTYVELGNLSSVNHTHLQLDSQEVMDFDNDGSYTFSNVGDGSHVLSVWMVRENHTLIGSIVHVNFSVAVPATPPDGGGGGGGGSGGGLQGPKTLKLTYLQIKSGISVEVAKDDKVEATYENNKTYIFTLTRIDSKVVLKYGSQTATFFSGDFSELDLDGDNINELKVVLRSLINGKAVLYFKKIEQTGVTEPPSVKQQQEEQSSSVNQEEQPLIENVRSNGWKILTAAIILLVLVGGVAWFAAWHHQHEVRKIADEFQEQFSA